MEKLKLKYQNKLPKLLLEFHSAFKNSYVAEYEFIEESVENLRSVTNKRGIDNDFYLFLQGPTGSLYGFWIIDEEDFINNPIVQFGGEGIFGVLASNFDHFLSQLYLLGADSWQLSNFISTTESPLFNEDYKNLSLQEFIAKHPRMKISQDDISQHITTVIDDFGGTETLNWLEKQKIPMLESSDLFKTIIETYLTHPNLQEFLNKHE